MIYHWPSAAVPGANRWNDEDSSKRLKPQRSIAPCLSCFTQADLDGFLPIQYSPPLSKWPVLALVWTIQNHLPCCVLEPYDTTITVARMDSSAGFDCQHSVHPGPVTNGDDGCIAGSQYHDCRHHLVDNDFGPDTIRVQHFSVAAIGNNLGTTGIKCCFHATDLNAC